MIKLELTQEEAQQFMLMIDLALRAQGVRLAAPAALLAAKLEKAAQSMPPAEIDKAQPKSKK